MPANTLKSSLFNYDLPENLIAQYPLQNRDESKLLVVNRNNKSVSHHTFKEFPKLIPTESILFRNNVSVIKARIFAQKISGGRVECLLLRPTNSNNEWWCLLKPGKKLTVENQFQVKGEFIATVMEKSTNGEYRIKFNLFNSNSVLDLSEKIGETPLPPYIKRSHSDSKNSKDIVRYQTIYASDDCKGAVAAPTAGLHFSNKIFDELIEQNIKIHDLTLNVGAGTFRPVKTENIENHLMHKETYNIPHEACNALLSKNTGTKLAIGTTTVRAIEDFALKFEKKILPEANFNSDANVFIYPPEKFKVTDALLTNFHLPYSTLLCMVAAFLSPGDLEGIDWLKEIYRIAIEKKYRFYSYGDAMLIL